MLWRKHIYYKKICPTARRNHHSASGKWSSNSKISVSFFWAFQRGPDARRWSLAFFFYQMIGHVTNKRSNWHWHHRSAMNSFPHPPLRSSRLTKVLQSRGQDAAKLYYKVYSELGPRLPCICVAKRSVNLYLRRSLCQLRNGRSTASADSARGTDYP